MKKVARLAEIYSTAGFLEQTRSAPDQARTALEDFIDARLVALTHGKRWTAFLIVAAVTIVVTLLQPYWVGYGNPQNVSGSVEAAEQGLFEDREWRRHQPIQGRRSMQHAVRAATLLA
jgi:hypothetical protein